MKREELGLKWCKKHQNWVKTGGVGGPQRKGPDLPRAGATWGNLSESWGNSESARISRKLGGLEVI